MKLTCRCVVCAASARSSCEKPRLPRHSLSSRPSARSRVASEGRVWLGKPLIRGTIAERPKRCQFPARELRARQRVTETPRSTNREAIMLRIAMAGTFAASLEQTLRAAI